ncbi:hypothetical protein [Anaerotignum propionicum]|uniref:hypothetical protein n=1 Tax=Anaerotignum propionicum TaxID=28446 RepID=UPI00210D2F33|nr:hypothetical protein [Anaerotignum propionicum]MCQ4936778.1 hypothetical protein [Anaerotignum propionicum]
MSEGKKRRRFRINDDTMTTIVVLSLLFCVAVVVAGMILAFFGVDVSAIVGNALTVFGTELGICGIMTIFNRWADRQDKQAERRKESRLRREESENERKRNEQSAG